MGRERDESNGMGRREEKFSVSFWSFGGFHFFMGMSLRVRRYHLFFSFVFWALDLELEFGAVHSWDFVSVIEILSE